MLHSSRTCLGNRMNNYHSLIWILIGIFFPGYIFSQGVSYSSNHKYPVEPAFEKVYVCAHQLVNMPDGLYYYDENGCSTKVKTVLGDENGTYLVLVNYQCSLCGRTHASKTPDEDFGCPLFMKQIHPKIWSSFN
jgi:hypothetical protein